MKSRNPLAFVAIAAAAALAGCGQAPETTSIAPADAPRAGSLEQLRKDN